MTQEVAPGLLVRQLPEQAIEIAAADDPETLLLVAAARVHAGENRLREQAFQESYKALTMEALYDVGLAIASTLNLEDLAGEILLRAVSLLDARRGALYLLRNGELCLEGTIGGGAPKQLPAESNEDEAQILDDARFELSAAIEVDGGSRGLIVIADKESRTGVGPFDEKDELSLSLFANQAAIALENAALHRQALDKERLEREMQLAAEIQRGLLPGEMPQLGDVEVQGWNRPTRQVGGDYYGALELADGRQAVVVADVTGKGMPAALLVSTLHSALDLLLSDVDSAPETLARINQHIFESTSANKFITLIMVLYEPGADHFHFINAGHNPGLLVDENDEVHQLMPGGLPLGLMPGSTYTMGEMALRPDNLVCLFSDGITECESPDGEEWGEERLSEFLVAERRRPLDDLIRYLDQTVATFAEGLPQHDDQTVVLMRRD